MLKLWRCASVSTLLLLSVNSWAGTVNFIQEGEKFLQDDNPSEALIYLEAALGQGSVSEKLYLDLSLAYERTEMREEAKKMLRKGIELEGPLQYLLYYNLGNLAYADKDWESAEKAFSEAVRFRPRFSEGLLNRANTRVNRSDWTAAAEDYGRYLVLEPQSPQRPKIEQMLDLLHKQAALAEQAKQREEAEKLADLARQKRAEEDRLAEAEKARVAEENRRVEEEKKRLEEESRKQEAARIAAEEARRQAEILEKIRSSLSGVSGDSQNLSSGSTGLKKQEEEFTLDQ